MMKSMLDSARDPERRPVLGPAVRVAVLAIGMAVIPAGCDHAEPVTPVPTPADMSQVDPWVAHEIEVARKAVEASPEDAARWMALGHLFYAHNYFGLAVDAYTTSLQLAPDQPRTSYMLAVALRADGDSEVAIDELEQTLGLDSETPHLRWRAAEWLIESGEIDRAAEMAREAVALGPEDRNAVRMLARVMLEQGHPEEAVELLSPLLLRDPGDQEVRSLRGRALRAAGRVDEAARDMLLAGDIQPKWFDEWINEALVCRTDRAWWIRRIQRIANEGDPAAARALLGKLRRWHPDSREVDFTEGVVLVNERRLAEAVVLFENLVAEDPSWAAARVRSAATRLARADSTADAIAALEDREFAAAMLEAAIENEPDNDAALRLLARCRERQERPADAVPLRRRLLEVVPGDRGNRLRLAQALLASGEADTAVEVLDGSVADFGPEGLPAMVVRVEALVKASRPEDAARALEALRARAPRHPRMGRLDSLVEGAGGP